MGRGGGKAYGSFPPPGFLARNDTPPPLFVRGHTRETAGMEASPPYSSVLKGGGGGDNCQKRMMAKVSPGNAKQTR